MMHNSTVARTTIANRNETKTSDESGGICEIMAIMSLVID